MRHGTTLALALGLGGGALVWHFTRGHKRPRAATSSTATAATVASPVVASPTPAASMPAPAAVAPISTSTAAPGPSAPSASTGTTPATPNRCALRLDAWGLRLDGAEIDIPTAVERCKAGGEADLTLEGNAPAWTYMQLLAALGVAGVRVNRWKV